MNWTYEKRNNLFAIKNVYGVVVCITIDENTAKLITETLNKLKLY